MRDHAVDEHHYACGQIDHPKIALVDLPWVANCFIAFDQPEYPEEEEDHCDPEIGVFDPRILSWAVGYFRLLAHHL